MDKAVAPKAIDAAREMGFNFFDMAPQYGTGKKDGIAEFILGRGLRTCRKEVIVSTKFGRKPTEGNKASFNGLYARRSVEESLQRIATDYIDLLFFHSLFLAREIDDDVWESLGRLK